MSEKNVDDMIARFKESLEEIERFKQMHNLPASDPRTNERMMQLIEKSRSSPDKVEQFLKRSEDTLNDLKRQYG